MSDLTRNDNTSKVEHKQVAGSVGGPGECGVECACGTGFDGFDTIAEANAILDSHIEDERLKAESHNVTEQTFARRLRQVRREQGFSQVALAALVSQLGVKIDALAILRIEKNADGPGRSIRLGEAVAIAAALDVDLTYLTGSEQVAPMPGAPSAEMRQAFVDVARAVVTGQMDERISLAWQVFSNSLKGGAS